MQIIKLATVAGPVTESEVVDAEDYFQIEFVDGEPVFACNICNEGFNSEAEIREHINMVKNMVKNV